MGGDYRDICTILLPRFQSHRSPRVPFLTDEEALLRISGPFLTLEQADLGQRPGGPHR